MAYRHPVDQRNHDDYVKSLESDLREAQETLREAYALGSKQAEEWDRFWKALGVLSADITVDQAIQKWKDLQERIKVLEGALTILSKGNRSPGVLEIARNALHGRGGPNGDR